MEQMGTSAAAMPALGAPFPSRILQCVARASFDAAEYGAEYLDLAKGMLVEVIGIGPADQGWAHVSIGGVEGWVPAEYVQISLYCDA